MKYLAWSDVQYKGRIDPADHCIVVSHSWLLIGVCKA